MTSVQTLVTRLRDLHRRRYLQQDAMRRRKRRPPGGPAARARILAKTNGRCHICGGTIQDRWQADHVLAHSAGGGSTADNFLPAHALCNNYRWDYLPDEFQLILRIGVWARTQMERETAVGREMAEAFSRHEHGVSRRRSSGHRESA